MYLLYANFSENSIYFILFSWGLFKNVVWIPCYMVFIRHSAPFVRLIGLCAAKMLYENWSNAISYSIISQKSKKCRGICTGWWDRIWWAEMVGCTKWWASMVWWHLSPPNYAKKIKEELYLFLCRLGLLFFSFPFIIESATFHHKGETDMNNDIIKLLNLEDDCIIM